MAHIRIETFEFSPGKSDRGITWTATWCEGALAATREMKPVEKSYFSLASLYIDIKTNYSELLGIFLDKVTEFCEELEANDCEVPYDDLPAYQNDIALAGYLIEKDKEIESLNRRLNSLEEGVN